MQKNSLPEIEASDLQAAREFLNISHEEKRSPTAPRAASPTPGVVTVHKGITRARFRSVSKGLS